jgi:hypothetical protein
VTAPVGLVSVSTFFVGVKDFSQTCQVGVQSFARPATFGIDFGIDDADHVVHNVLRIADALVDFRHARILGKKSRP